MKARSRSSSILIRPSKSSPRKPGGKRWTKARVLRELKCLANLRVREKMPYFGVRVPKAFGISAPVLRALARRIGKNHQLAERLWNSGIHEARLLATLVGESGKVTPQQMERWARDFDSWDVVDASCCYFMPLRLPLGKKRKFGAAGRRNSSNARRFPWWPISALKISQLRTPDSSAAYA